MPPKKDPFSNPTRNALMLFSLLLYSGRSYSLKRLAELLNCSRQSVLRLLSQICTSREGSIVSWMEDGQRFYKLATPETRPRPVLSEEEMEQMILCREWLGGLLPDGMKESLARSAQKSTALLEDFSRRGEALLPLGRSASKGRIDYTPFEECLKNLISAIRYHQVLEISYQSASSDTPRSHEIVPAHLLAYHEGIYVRG